MSGETGHSGDGALKSLLLERFGPEGDLAPLAPDASTRLFFRLTRPDRSTSILLVDRDGGESAHERLLAAHEFMRSAGVPVPAIEDRDLRLLAIRFEDFGDRLLADELPHCDAARERELYAQVASVAAAIAAAGPASTVEGGPLASDPLGEDRLRRELRFFESEDLDARRGLGDEGLRAELKGALDRLAALCASRPPFLAHRDLHARNLMLTPEGTLGVVDFQDALLAPDLYDLASLIHDPYVRLRPETRDGAMEAFALATGREREELDAALVPVALQRLLKALGTYAHQVVVRRKRRFAESIPVAESRALDLARLHDEATGEGLVPLLRRAGFADDPSSRPSG